MLSFYKDKKTLHILIGNKLWVPTVVARDEYGRRKVKGGSKGTNAYNGPFFSKFETQLY